MELNNLKTISKRRHKRLGLGHGSGRGKTAGRGTKGQNAKGKRPIFFEGGAVPLTKRLPFMRGKGRNKVFKNKAIAINLGELNQLSKNSIVDEKTLVEKGIIKSEDAKKYGIKILGDGKLTVALTVNIPVSKNAKIKIEKAGGKVAIINLNG